MNSNGHGKPQGLERYLERMDADGTPVLGHLVLYSVFDSDTTRDDVERWFRELGLDEAFLPLPIRAVDAFQKVTGPAGVRVSYPLDDVGPPDEPGRRRRRRRGPGEAPRRVATLMVRHVRHNAGYIVRHLVREVRDEGETRLSYDVRLAECVFNRNLSAGAEPGAGELRVVPDNAAIRDLAEVEQRRVLDALEQIQAAHIRQCTYLGADRLRTMLRTYVESLNAVRVRPTGGVYFVHRQHADTLVGLRELVRRFGGGSHLARVPIPDQEEMREMVIAAFTTKAQEDLGRLAADIAEARRSDDLGEAAVAALHRRFTQLADAANEHSLLLNTSLEDTRAALQLVHAQLASLLAGVASA